MNRVMKIIILFQRNKAPNDSYVMQDVIFHKMSNMNTSKKFLYLFKIQCPIFFCTITSQINVDSILSTQHQPESRRITNYGRRRRRRVEPRVHGPLDRIFSPTHPLPHRMGWGLPVPPGPFLTFPWLGGTEGRCLAYMEPWYLPFGLYTFLGSVRPFEAFLTS